MPSRYWYSTQPTVTKLADDRAEQLKRDPDKVVHELDLRLRKNLEQKGDFSRIHPMPQTGQDVPDDVDARLVVLGVDLWRCLSRHQQPLTKSQTIGIAWRAKVEWQAVRLSGQDPLAVGASKKLRSEELLLTGFAATRLRMELDRVPLWRGDHVATRQLVEDFARYLYLPRIKEPGVLLQSIRDGLGLLTWSKDSFAFAESYDEAAGRYRGLRCGQMAAVSLDDTTSVLVKPEIAQKQTDTEKATTPPGPTAGGETVGPPPGGGQTTETGGATTGPPTQPVRPKRFYGTAPLDPTRVGRDAGRIADEVIAHLSGLVGSSVKVTLEIEADISGGAPENVVRTVTENSRTLKFSSYGFEEE